MQILIFQANRLEGSDPIRLDIERFVAEGLIQSTQRRATQSTPDSLGAVEPAQQGHAVSSTSTSSEYSSTARGQAPREELFQESPQGSFEFQPVLTETGELTFRATTL